MLALTKLHCVDMGYKDGHPSDNNSLSVGACELTVCIMIRYIQTSDDHMSYLACELTVMCCYRKCNPYGPDRFVFSLNMKMVKKMNMVSTTFNFNLKYNIV